MEELSHYKNLIKNHHKFNITTGIPMSDHPYTNWMVLNFLLLESEPETEIGYRIPLRQLSCSLKPKSYKNWK